MVAPEVESADRVRRAIGKLNRQLNAYAAGEGLTPSQASALHLISRRGPIGLSKLAQLEGLNPTMVSRIVGRLEESRLIRRTADQTDLRAARVEITQNGRDVDEQILNDRNSVVAACLAQLSESQQHLVLAALPALEELAQALANLRNR